MRQQVRFIQGFQKTQNSLIGAQVVTVVRGNNLHLVNFKFIGTYFGIVAERCCKQYDAEERDDFFQCAWFGYGYSNKQQFAGLEKKYRFTQNPQRHAQRTARVFLLFSAVLCANLCIAFIQQTINRVLL